MENQKKKQQPTITSQMVLDAILKDEIKDLFKQTKYRVTHAPLVKAVAIARGLNKSFKVPDLITEKIAELESVGRSGGIRGRVARTIGDKAEYSIQKKKQIVVPTGMYGWSKDGGKVQVEFQKDRIVITPA